MTKNIAVILAGGVGSRSGLDIPKQFYKIDNKTILAYTVEAFDKNSHIDKIVVVAHKEFVELCTQICFDEKFEKVCGIIEGGKERYNSTINAIEFCKDEDCNLIIHDSVRPLVSSKIIDNVALALQTHAAVGVAVPLIDTIITTQNGEIESVPDRNSFMRVQTPQAFKLEVIKEAYSIGLRSDNFKTTDDCGVVINYLPSQPIFIVEGDERNRKFTTKEDFEIAKVLFDGR